MATRWVRTLPWKIPASLPPGSGDPLYNGQRYSSGEGRIVMSIAKRLQLGSGLIAMIVLLAIAIAAYSINLVRIGGPVAERIQSASDYVADILPPPAYVLEPFLEATLLVDHPEQVEQRAAHLAALRKAYDERQAYWKTGNISPELAAALTQDADVPAQRFWQQVARLETAARKGDTAAMRDSYAAIASAYAEHRTQIDRAVTLATDYQANLKQDAHRSLTTASSALLVLALTILALAIGAGVYLTRKVMAPLDELIQSTTTLAGGQDCTVPHLGRTDELGAMAEAVDFFRRSAKERAAQDARAAADTAIVADGVGQVLRRMAAGDLRHGTAIEFPAGYTGVNSDLNGAVETLRKMVCAVVETTNEIDGASRSIAGATEELARRTESSAAAIEQTSAAVNRMDERLRSTAEAARKTSDGSQQTLDAASEVRTRTDGAMEAMHRVSKSTSGIDDVIEGLDKIAFQTRVLAMNAAVEAGRAGDAGRGFAVVADLVSTLAMRAEEEAKRARTQLSATQEDVTVAVEAVGLVDGALQTILTRCTEAAALTQGIADDNVAQSIAIGEINSAVSQLDQIVQQNAAMVDQTSAAAGGLARDVQRLAGHAAAFQYDLRASDVPVTVERRKPRTGASAGSRADRRGLANTARARELLPA
ncbi:methyl-accepting chemotaxis protein [Sphingomonas sp. PvP056]|uniref:methyl-accepting chemotaxis protein n=1 Tax=Sphingomonas sp. PvP056 TaxID=3156392 RepID=UPI00339412E2